MEQFAPCPKCGGTNATKATFTWWGGLLGPKILKHAKCNSCKTGYNYKTGKDNLTGIIIYSVVVGVVCLFLLLLVFGLLGVLMYSSSR